MDQQSRSMRSRTPLVDVTNTSTRGVPNGEAPDREDSKERKRQKEKERYAAMTQEKKDELNKKRRERRQQKNVHASGDHIPMEGDEHNDWLGRGNLEQYNDTKHLLGDALETIGDGMHDTCFESPIAERGVPTGQVPYREDPKDRKRRKEKERYAAMSQEKKDELNRKRRERRKQKNVPASDGGVSMEEDENNDRLDMEHVESETTDICVSMEEDENNDRLHKGSLDQHNETEHLVENTPAASGALQYFGLKAEQAPLIIIQDGESKKFLKDHIESDKIVSWLKEYFDGKLSPFRKSEPISEVNNEPVKVVVADSIHDVVCKSGKNVHVEFYAPWCGHCKKLEL